AEQFREGTVEKVYWAVVEGTVAEPAGTLNDWLRHDDAAKRVEVVAPQTPAARPATLHYHRKAAHGGLTLLELRPRPAASTNCGPGGGGGGGRGNGGRPGKCHHGGRGFLDPRRSPATPGDGRATRGVVFSPGLGPTRLHLQPHGRRELHPGYPCRRRCRRLA